MRYPTQLSELQSGDLVRIRLIIKLLEPDRLWYSEKLKFEYGHQFVYRSILVPIYQNIVNQQLMVVYSMFSAQETSKQIHSTNRYVMGGWFDPMLIGSTPIIGLISYSNLEVAVSYSWCVRCGNYCNQNLKQCQEFQNGGMISYYRNWVKKWQLGAK